MITRIGKIKIFGYDFTFVGKCRYGKPKDKKEDFLGRHTDWRDWKIGLFFRRTKVVGRKNFSTPKEWSNNFCKRYMFGIDLLIIMGWFTVCKGAMEIEIEE